MSQNEGMVSAETKKLKHLGVVLMDIREFGITHTRWSNASTKPGFYAPNYHREECYGKWIEVVPRSCREANALPAHLSSASCLK